MTIIYLHVQCHAGMRARTRHAATNNVINLGGTSQLPATAHEFQSANPNIYIGQSTDCVHKKVNHLRFMMRFDTAVSSDTLLWLHDTLLFVALCTLELHADKI